MKITLENTDEIVWLEYGEGDQQAMPGRIWEGVTESGIYVQAIITRVAVPADADQSRFERELISVPAPRPSVPNVFPLRMIL